MKLLLLLAVISVTLGRSGDQSPASDAAAGAGISRMAEQIQALAAEVRQLREQMDALRLESATLRVSRLQQELNAIAAARHELEAREAERAEELSEAEQYIAQSAPKGSQLELAETVRLELAVTRPTELAREQSVLDSREAALRARLETEERARAVLQDAVRRHAQPAISQ